MNAVTQKVAAGDLTARAQIATGDEVENLATNAAHAMEGKGGAWK